jgi:hypothetical protein
MFFALARLNNGCLQEAIDVHFLGDIAERFINVLKEKVEELFLNSSMNLRDNTEEYRHSIGSL